MASSEGSVAGCGTPRDPVVAIWRSAWLAPSETFIRDQVAALTRWRPVRVGLRRIAGSLTPADLVPLGSSRAAELRTETLGSLGLRRRLADFLADQGTRVVHAHFGPDAITAAPVARRLGVPLVVTCHGYDVTRLPQLGHGIGREYRRRLRRVLRSADALVAVSSFIAERMVDLGAPADRVRVQPIGIDLRGASVDDPPPSGDGRGVLFVGRLVPKKGVRDALTAWSRLPAELRSVHPLRIVGSGPLAGEVAAHAAEVDGPVELLGYQTSDQVAALLDRSALYLQPSQTADDGDAEGLGMVFLEAALHGLPVAAYRHGGVTEAVLDGVTGLLVDEGDVAGLSSRMAELLVDRDLAVRLGWRGRDRVVTDFDVRRCTAELETLYDSLL